MPPFLQACSQCTCYQLFESGYPLEPEARAMYTGLSTSPTEKVISWLSHVAGEDTGARNVTTSTRTKQFLFHAVTQFQFPRIITAAKFREVFPCNFTQLSFQCHHAQIGWLENCTRHRRHYNRFWHWIPCTSHSSYFLCPDATVGYFEVDMIFCLSNFGQSIRMNTKMSLTRRWTFKEKNSRK
jgi:hypothetical protein